MKQILLGVVVFASLIFSFNSGFSAPAKFNQKDWLVFDRFIEGVAKMKVPDFSGFKKPEVSSAFGRVLQSGELDEKWFQQTRDRLLKKGILFRKIAPDGFTSRYPSAYLVISNGKRAKKIILVPTYPPVISAK